MTAARGAAGRARGRCALLVAVAVLLPAAVHAAPPPRVPTAVLTRGAANAVGRLEDRIFLDQRLQRAELARARLIWVAGADLSPVQWRRVLGAVRRGAGLVLVAGKTAPDLAPLGLEVLEQRTDRVSLQVVGEQDPLLTGEVVWRTAPQVARRWVLRRGASSPLRAVVAEQGSGHPVLLSGRLGQGRVFVLSVRLAHPQNREVVLWPYFNYLAHVVSSRAAGLEADTYADWPAAPVPGGKALVILVVGLIVAWLVTLIIFVKVRGYSRRHPEILDGFFKQAAPPPGESKDGVPPPEAHGAAAQRARWRNIGFTRSLAGFLTLAGTLFVLFAPFYYVTNILVPNHVQPFPQAKGIWEFAWEALQIAWFLFDAGTFVAFVKYFAEFRIKDPAEAVRSAQFFVWWQILTGLVQVTMASIVAVVFLPHTPYGYSSNFVILIALSQYPGFFGVLTFFFQAYQRYDYNIGLDLLSDWVLRFGLQIPFVLLFRAWGRANPEYGEAFGAAVGIGIGFYVSTLVTFGVGLVLYKRLGLRLTPLLMAHFDRRTAWRMLVFGFKVVLGQVFFRAAKTIDRVVISLLLINYTEWLGIEGQIHYNLMFLFPIAYRFFETAMAALSESHGNDKPVLTQYYLVRFFQVGFLYTAIGLSLMWAMGPYFVRHAMDPQWARAAEYMVIAAVIGVFYAPAWISDMLQKGAGRPGLFAVILGVEQALRIGLFFLLIPRYQFWGFYLALLITIAAKVVGAWIVNHLLIVRLRLYLWQMLVAPALAGLLNFALLRLTVTHLGLTGRLEVVLLFFAAALLSFFVCFFAMGLFGGFDQVLAGELKLASRMTGVLSPLTRLFYLAARAGWALSPLHDRFPVTIHAPAMAEAHALERERSVVDHEEEVAAQARAGDGDGRGDRDGT